MASKIRLGCVVGAALVVAHAGCGKKSSSSDDSPALEKLELSSELVLLPAQSTTSQSLTGSSDAEVRKIKLRVNSDAFEAAKQVESILCYFSQTKFWEQVGKDAYQVLVDSDKCDGDKGDSSQGQEGATSSSNQGKNYITAFAKAEADGSAVAAKILFRMEEEGKKQEYHAKIKVTEQPSDKYPIGIFEMYFTGYNSGTKAGTGSIKVAKGDGDKFTVEFMESTNRGGSSADVTQLKAELENTNGEGFVGKLNSKGNSSGGGGTQTYEFKVAFDKSFANVSGTLSRANGSFKETVDPSGCFDRKKFVTAIYNYDLAEADGRTLKELSTGFPIEATIGGKPAMGFAGYHGVGFNDRSFDSKLANGDTVNKVSFSDGAKTLTPYTVVKAPGKLIKFKRATTTLAALKGTDLSMFDSGSNYLVRWNGSAFAKVAKVSFGSNGPVEEAASGTVTIPQWGLFVYSQALNAGIKIPSGVTLTDSTTIGYHSEEIVTGSANAPTEALKCFQDCPKVTFTSASQLKRSNPTNGCPPAGTMFEAGDTLGTCTSTQKQSLATPIASYTFSTSSMNISNGSTAFALPDTSSVKESEANDYGFRSGALIPDSVYNALSAATKAKFPGGAEMDVETFYRWESGASSWNRFTGLKDSKGALASFDKPLDLAYTHSTANDFDGYSTYDGKAFRLNYGGPGQLWGIPFKYNSELKRGAPLFAIKDQSSATSGGTTYKIVPVRGEQYMKKAASTSSCESLSVASAPALPAAVDSAADSIENTADIASATVIRYIGGEAAK